MSLILSTILLAAPMAFEEPFLSLSFEEAKARAAAEEKLVMVDFFTTWCGPCKRLDQTTWKATSVRDWLGEHTLALKIDAEQQVDLALHYRVGSYPTILFVDGDGTEVERLTGYRDAKTFLDEAQSLLDGKDSFTRIVESLDDDPDQPQLRMDHGDALSQRGQYDEALQQYLWCYDDGMKHRAIYSGVRNSFLLGKIIRMGESYPAALDAIRTRARDAGDRALSAPAEEEIVAPEGLLSFLAGDPRLKLIANSNDAKAIWSRLEETGEILALYDALLEKGDGYRYLRSPLVAEILPQLIEARRYKDATSDAKNPMTMIRILIKMTPKDRGDPDQAAERSSMVDDVIARAAPWFEACAGTRLHTKARGVVDEITEYEPRGSTYAELIRRAVRADAIPLAREILARGRSTLPVIERVAIEQAALGIPGEG